MACHSRYALGAIRGVPCGPDRKKQEFWAPAVAVQRATPGSIRRPKGSGAACA
jgi:hypothetical protein